jgi:3-phosphoshikimate 1-carboxyvinyltransferase
MTASWWSSTEAVAVPAGRVARGRLAVPSSKSLTHRALTLALLAEDEVTIERPLDAEDTRLFAAALARLGHGVERGAGSWRITPPTARPALATLDCGNAGTFFRFALAALATLPGRFLLDGVPRLRERPVGALLAALRALGARVRCLEREGYAPLEVEGPTLAAGRVRLEASQSSQFLSALLFAGQRAGGPIEIEVGGLVSAPYVELTRELLLAHGGAVERPAPDVWVTRPARLVGGRVAIEADVSAAAYPAAAAALTGGRVELPGVRLDSRQGDRRLLELLAAMGARVSAANEGTVVEGGDLAAIEVDAADIPDQVPTLAALAPFARGTTRICRVAHLRIKESDRLAAMASELARAGARVEELADGLVVPGVWADASPPATPVAVETHGDHRIAMAMALVALRRPGVSILHPAVVGKSYPEFWRDLARLLGEAA